MTIHREIASTTRENRAKLAIALMWLFIAMESHFDDLAGKDELCCPIAKSNQDLGTHTMKRQALKATFFHLMPTLPLFSMDSR